MKLRSDIRINGKLHRKGTTIPWYSIYPFFLIHMLMFGLSGFFMAYSSGGPDLSFLYMHGRQGKPGKETGRGAFLHRRFGVGVRDDLYFQILSDVPCRSRGVNTRPTPGQSPP